MLYPKVAWRDCGHCQAFLYDELTGRPAVTGQTQRSVPRSKHSPPPCRTPKGCPKGTPEHSNELTPENDQAYRHYLECRAVNSFPNDPIVRRYAAIIREIEDDRDRQKQIAERRELVQLMTLASAAATVPTY